MGCRSYRSIQLLGLAIVMVLFTVPAMAQAPSVCDGIDCDTLPDSICDAGGFKVTLTDFVAADDPANLTGNAIYTYQVCNPVLGVCSGDGTSACDDHDDCTKGGNPPGGTCNRECAVDLVRGLSHFDVDFPSLGDTCLSDTNFVGGTCACVPAGGGCSVDPVVVFGDGSCPNDGTVAKCDNTTLPVGSCIEMVLQISGEEAELGLGAAIVVSKESTDCNESCLAGPSCERCDDDTDEGDECLTRTLGFWGTHPWITNNYVPVTVCGQELVCDGPDNGESNPSCGSGTCNDVMEGLGSVGGELRNGSAYIAMVKQLTAAKLSLAATAAVAEGATCSDFEYAGLSIQEWISKCEGFCDKSQSQISGSGCIEALDAFNNSEDTGFDQAPAPFDQAPIDDHGNVSGADPSAFTAAHGGGVVIGKNVPGQGGQNCAAAAAKKPSTQQ
ncbi:MAG: hypothetical protein ACREAA_03545 [Candidatus Polarisedimenticolia bacterium]